MDSQNRAIRALLQTMSPRRAEEYIRSFHLPEEEELFLLECDVRGKSYVQAAKDNNTTPEVIKRRRRRAYGKISDEINFIISSRRFENSIISERLEIGMSEEDARKFLMEI